MEPCVCVSSEYSVHMAYQCGNMTLIVHSPVCTAMYGIVTQENITKHRYHSIDELEADVVLLCQNTHTYNVEGSQVNRSCDHTV